MRRNAVLVLLCACLAAPAHAVTVVPLTFEQLVLASSAVVYGRVTDVQSRWTEDRQRIESVITVDVIKGLKGAERDAVTLTVPGGQVGRYLNLIPGSPSFARGDLAVFFLTAQGARLPVTTGFTQGIYRVQPAQASGELLVMPPPPAAGAGGRIVRGDRARKPVSLAVFESSVRAAAGSAK